jgi:hypothetical protein
MGFFSLLTGRLCPFIVNWQAMPIYSGAVIATGAALIVLAMIPFSWIESVAHWLDSDRRR